MGKRWDCTFGGYRQQRPCFLDRISGRRCLWCESQQTVTYRYFHALAQHRGSRMGPLPANAAKEVPGPEQGVAGTRDSWAASSLGWWPLVTSAQRTSQQTLMWMDGLRSRWALILCEPPNWVSALGKVKDSWKDWVRAHQNSTSNYKFSCKSPKKVYFLHALVVACKLAHAAWERLLTLADLVATQPAHLPLLNT